MPNKTHLLFRIFLTLVFLISIGFTSIFAEKPKEKSSTIIQIYYSGAQSGYIEPCG